MIEVNAKKNEEGLPSPLFILGAPRSGTTFLAGLLKYSDYGTPFETHFITKYFKKLGCYGDLSIKDNFIRLLKDISRERYIQQWKINFDFEQIWMSASHKDFATLCHTLIMQRQKTLGLTSWGDKTPHFIFDIPILLKLFPDAKFIYIIRDGRDVALSLLEKKWGPNNVYACAKFWAEANNIQEHVNELAIKKQIVSLHYEELLQNTEYEVEKFFNFLNLSVDEPAMEKMTSRTIKNNSLKWKTKMSKENILLFDSVASAVLAQHGYEVSEKLKPISSAQRIFWESHDKLVTTLRLIELNTIDWFKIKFLGKEPFGE